MAKEFKLGVINTRRETSDTDVNTPDKLADSLHSLVINEFPEDENCLLTLTKFNKRAYKNLDKKFLNKYESYFGRFSKNDSTASFWSENDWEAVYKDGKKEFIWSDKGKYSGVVFENKKINKRLLYVSVHLPREVTKKIQSQSLLEQLIKEDSKDKYEADDVIVAGNFHMKPDEVFDFFGSEFNIGIESSNKYTTRGRSSIDNVVTSDAMCPIVKIYNEYKKLPHYPLFANIKFNEEE